MSTSTTTSRSLFPVSEFLGLIRFSHTIFALPFALLASILAWHEKGQFRWIELTGVLLAMVFARSAAMAFNRLVDRKFDAANPRTASRHLPAGRLSVFQVTLFLIVCSLAFVASTLLFLPNTWPLVLSVPVLAFLLAYSYVKRFSIYCHYWLSAALMLSPLAAWIAITGTITIVPLLLSSVIFFWVGGFDILYACQDTHFDREHNLHSIPARMGVRASLKIAAFSHFLMMICLLLFWFFGNFGIVFMGGLLVLTALLIYQHSLVSEHDLSRVNIAFFHTNAALSFGILVFAVLDLALRQYY